MGKENDALARWVGDLRFDVETGNTKTGNVETGAGQHRLPLDGDGQAGPSPMDLLVAGLAGCTGMDVVATLRKMRQDVAGLEVAVHGTRQEEHPRVYREIHVEYVISGRHVREAAVRRAIALSETKYCGVGATLAQTATITTAFRIVEAE